MEAQGKITHSATLGLTVLTVVRATACHSRKERRAQDQVCAAACMQARMHTVNNDDNNAQMSALGYARMHSHKCMPCHCSDVGTHIGVCIDTLVTKLTSVHLQVPYRQPAAARAKMVRLM